MGLIGMGGKKPGIMAQFNNSIEKLMSVLENAVVSNFCDFNLSLSLSNLYLKNTLGGNTKRLIIFVCSPFEIQVGSLMTLVESLKANKIKIIIYSFGDIEQNHEKLKYLVENVGNESILVEIYSNDDFILKVANSNSGYLFPSYCPGTIYLKNPDSAEKEILKELKQLELSERPMDID